MFSHGDLTIRIKDKTVEISKDSSNSKLYLERGLLYEQHSEFNKAIADYLKSEKLGSQNNLLYYRKAKAYYSNSEYNLALSSAKIFIEKSPSDIEIYKLQAQILYKLENYDEALASYNYVIKESVEEISPKEFLEYCDIILAADNLNYKGALEAIEIGLSNLGDNTFTLQSRKLEYLKALNQTEKVLEQYNYFILINERKEGWYYKKAEYLMSIERYQEANIALQQSKMAIQQLNPKFKETEIVKELTQQINLLEIRINQK